MRLVVPGPAFASADTSGGGEQTFLLLGPYAEGLYLDLLRLSVQASAAQFFLVNACVSKSAELGVEAFVSSPLIFQRCSNRTGTIPIFQLSVPANGRESVEVPVGVRVESGPAYCIVLVETVLAAVTSWASASLDSRRLVDVP